MTLAQTAAGLFALDKGLLAIDESPHTCNKRFDALGIPQTLEARRDYRELLITAPDLTDAISGMILCDETFRQRLGDGTPMPQAMIERGILPGIKVDGGEVALAGHPGAQITEGLDGLRQRLAEYVSLGARFTKWRAVLEVGERSPTTSAIDANAHALSRFAALSQEAGLVPIVEPEVLMSGSHSLEQCRLVTEQVLRAVFAQLVSQGVEFEGLVLKPNMVTSGSTSGVQDRAEAVATATLTALRRTVPAAVPAIAFLSGGQAPEVATSRLNSLNGASKDERPWALAFSFARAIQRPALELWGGAARNVVAAQRVLLHRATCNLAARRGEYTASMEHR